MTLPADLPIVDHHCHLSPTGEGVAAARRFRKAGGTHLFLTTHNWAHTPLRSVDDYARQFEGIETLGHQIETATGVSARLVVAPYPVDLLQQVDALGLAAAEQLHTEALDLAGTWVRDHRAVALGEVGWPHFPVDPEIVSLAQRLFAHALATARDVGCPAVVHCDDLDGAGYARLASLARAAGLPAERVIKHYARTFVPADERHGISPSVLARRALLAEILDEGAPWFLETDFLDDPTRPGAVLDLETVPRRAAEIARAHPEQIDRLRVPFEVAIQRLYGFTPQVPPGRS